MPSNPQDWNSYLQMLDLSNPTLAAHLRAALGGLIDAVPPAGEYLESMDYETLYPALAGEYVTEVIQKYEATLGEAPELYEAAVAAGYLTQEQVAALSTQSTTNVGSLQQRFAAQGGLRTLAGPYQAARTEILQQALAEMQTAASKASSDAYQLASMTTGQRVQALDAAGRHGVGLVNAGVSRRNQQTASGAGEQGEMQIPGPPDQPSVWEKILAGAIPAAITAGGALLGRSMGPKEQTPQERAERQLEYEESLKAGRESRAAEAKELATLRATAEERPPGWQGSGGDATLSQTNPYSGGAPSDAGFGEAPYGGGQSMPPQVSYGGIPQTGTASGWPMPQQSPSYSFSEPLPNYNYRQPSANNDYGWGGYSYYDDPYQGYYQYDTPSYSGGYDDPYQGSYYQNYDTYYPSSDSYYTEYY